MRGTLECQKLINKYGSCYQTLFSVVTPPQHQGRSSCPKVHICQLDLEFILQPSTHLKCIKEEHLYARHHCLLVSPCSPWAAPGVHSPLKFSFGIRALPSPQCPSPIQSPGRINIQYNNKQLATSPLSLKFSVRTSL